MSGIVFARAWKPASDRPPDPHSGEADTPHCALNPLRAYFDANLQGPGIHKWSHYFDIYHKHLSRFIGRDIVLLEIGVQSGGSMGMWTHYFGPRCRINGVDIDPNCKAFENERITIHIGDQEDRQFWRRFKSQVPAVDIVIDDGGHSPEQQRVTLEELLPHIRPGGIYICEDIHGLHNRFTAYVYGLADDLFGSEWIPGGQTEGETISVRTTPFQSMISSIHIYPFVTVIELAERASNRLVAQTRGSQWVPIH